MPAGAHGSAGGNGKRRTHSAVDSWNDRTVAMDSKNQTKHKKRLAESRIASMVATINPCGNMPENFKPTGEENIAAEKGRKAVKLAKGDAFHFQIISLFQRSHHTLTLLVQFKALLPPQNNVVHAWSYNQSPFLFLESFFKAPFNGIMKWKLKSLADTITAILPHPQLSSFTQNSLSRLSSSTWTLARKANRLQFPSWGNHTYEGHSFSNDYVMFRTLKFKTNTDLLRHYSSTFLGKHHLHIRGYFLPRAAVGRFFLILQILLYREVSAWALRHHDY